MLPFSSLFVPLTDGLSPADASSSWTKCAGELSLGGEQYVADTCVIKDGSTYRMWYAHGRTGVSPLDLVKAATAAISDAVINGTAALNFMQALTDLGNANTTRLQSMLNSLNTVIGYATSSDRGNWYRSLLVAYHFQDWNKL